MFKTKKILALFLIVGALFFWQISLVLAWSEPIGTPPTYNVDAPINVGNALQLKTGSIGIKGATPGITHGLAVGSGADGSIITTNSTTSAVVKINEKFYGLNVEATNRNSYNGVYSEISGTNSSAGYFKNNDLTGLGIRVLSAGTGGIFSGGKIALSLSSPETALKINSNKEAVISELINTGNQTVSRTKINFLDNRKVFGLRTEKINPSSGQVDFLVELARDDVGAYIKSINSDNLALKVDGNSSFSGDIFVAGALSVTQGCNGCSVGDLAENFAIKEDKITAGDIVALNEKLQLFKADKNENRVVGVISKSPSLNLNNVAGMPLALSGVVSVKVNSENGPILAGDFVAPSSTAGVGMKACSVGTVVGKALENFADNFGEIKVLVSLSYFPGITCQK